LILLLADILKEGFLRQVGFEGEEVFCPPAKQYVLLKLVLDFYDYAYKLIRAGVPVDAIASLPYVSDLMRMKEEPMSEVERLRESLMKALEEVARKHGVEVSP
jgi:V/A-type H+-transporting ATPase subunit A